MKRKILNVLFALVLVLGLSLVMAAPAAATATTFNVVPFTLYTGDNGTAAWSTVHKYTGSSSVLLTHHATNVGSDYVQFVPAAGVTLADITTIDADPEWSFWYYASAAPGPQLELKFTDPSSSGYVEVTLMPAQVGACAINTGTEVSVLAASGRAIWYGVGETGTAFNWETEAGVYTLADVEALINAETGVADASDWVLTRVRAELWEAGARTCYIDDITIDGTTYYGLIGDAVDVAADADIISVAAGTYNAETTWPIDINHDLTVQSVAGKATTIIDPGANGQGVIAISANGVTLDGFTV
jgi:hypothetical protein